MQRMISRIRKWQQDCLDQLLSDFARGKKHFFCLAATASGKTLLAAEFARQLIEMECIDYVLVFCPSLEIQKGIKHTFFNQLKMASGVDQKIKLDVLTYQAMLNLDESFWDQLKSKKTLAIFDEIHHCAGTPYTKSNSWGSRILNWISDQAVFVLGLSGTPWRSDELPIATAFYNRQTKIHCDFSYGLAEAVKDNVCRVPQVLLIDNANISVSVANGCTRNFTSIAEALINSDLKYNQLLNNLTAQRYMLKRGIEKLNELRWSHSPNAGGLVVANSVEHAILLSEMLRFEFKQSAEVVSYLHQNSSEVIDRFKFGETRWIVSVGMISEGTDIPRLQVCCFFSSVLTSMNYRQVLGRILRKTQSEDIIEKAWLYTFAEPSLVKHAHQLNIDIPEMQVNFETMQNPIKEPEPRVEMPEGESLPALLNPQVSQEELNFQLGQFDAQNTEKNDATDTESEKMSTETNVPPEVENTLSLINLKEKHFFEELVALYDYEDVAIG